VKNPFPSIPVISWFRFFVLLALLLPGFYACRDDGFDTDPSLRLSFSADSLLFDTVFTTVGSSTRSFMVYNNHNRRINISSITLAGGADSYFRVNVDGSSGIRVENVEIGARDSIFVFVEVTVDPVNQDVPLVIADSLVFRMNDQVQDVKLVAWGQDARFIHPNYIDPVSGIRYHLFEQDVRWTSELPYVIYGLAVVAPDLTLTVEEGARVHFHNNSSLIFLERSTMKVNGTAERPVSIQGDRLEPFYAEQPGQWGRIWFTATSRDHEINHAIIKNGTVGLHVDTIGSTTHPTLQIRNSVIRNMSLVGLLAQGSHVVAENLMVSNCGEHTLMLTLGGRYDFRHCTFANYYNLPNSPIRRTPSVVLNNYYEDADGNIQLRELEQLFMGNSIVYGSLQEEMVFDFFPGTSPSFTFDHCLIRTQENTEGSNFIQILKNQNPQFLRPQGDYRLKENSPAIGAGNPLISQQVPFDILGQSRLGRSDIGAVQYYPVEEDE
jgi:hypothetical protein